MQHTGIAGPAPPLPKEESSPPPHTPASSHADNVVFCVLRSNLIILDTVFFRNIIWRDVHVIHQTKCLA